MNFRIEQEQEHIEPLQEALDSLDNIYEDFTEEEEEIIEKAYKVLESKRNEYERKIEILNEEEMIYGKEEH